MEFTTPISSGFTVYGKSDCPYCVKVKDLLREFNEEYIYVNCDEYLIDKREEFLKYIATVAGVAHKTFPMVFSSGKFVGGYTDTFKMLIDREDEE